MTQKLLNLFVFATLLAILFLGCRADADIIHNAKYNAEYSSKSLWKEDEIYVKNVKEIFDKHIDVQKFSINYGVPMWDYATTFGHFDESFLMAPLLNESTVMGVIIATRIKDKVYFKYSTDIAAIVFFQNLLFPRNSRLRAENQLQESSKLVCSSRTYTMCFPDDFGDNCQPPTTVTTCVEINESFNEDPNGGGFDDGFIYDGGIGGSGGTSPSPKDTNNENPCEKAREMENKMAEILNNNDVNSAIQLLNNLIQQQIAGGQIKENAFAIGIDGKGKYYVSIIATALDSNPHSVAYKHFDATSGITQIGIYHNHTTDSSNSPGDFYELISSSFIYPNYNSNFAQNNRGEVFALNIYDRQKAMAFLQKYPKDQNTDGPEFKGELLADYSRLRSTADWNLNNNSDAAQVALVAFLELFDTGVSLSKQTDNESFKTFKSSNFSEPVYGGQQQTTFITTDCNQ